MVAVNACSDCRRAWPADAEQSVASSICPYCGARDGAVRLARLRFWPVAAAQPIFIVDGYRLHAEVTLA
jgi:hypothetical protein